ncbi:MAG: hypothetical protein CL823_01145 [Crocinitomicaceae bacterium]|nr:hypothetical protein [Crocinitomicaceae bacterium]
MQSTRTFLFTGILAIFAVFQVAVAAEDGTNVLPSFTVDVTEGAQASGLVVHCTNTSINIDETCGTNVSYAWSIDNGAMGVDWILVEGTTETTQNLAVEFITQGCYNITLTASDCNNVANTSPTEITIAGPPQLIIDDFTSVSTCSNGQAEALWQMASNNNNSVNFNVFIDGAPLFSNNYGGLSSCITPGTILFADVISAGFLSPGMHQLIFQAQGDLYNIPTIEIIDFEVFEAPSLSISTSAGAFCSYEQATVNANINFGLQPYVIDWSIDGLSQYTETVIANNSSYSFDLNGINGATTILVNLVDANGCTTSETINIEIYDDVDFTLTTTPTCENTAAEFVATGNATQYVWPDALFSVTSPVEAVGGNDTQSAVMGDGIAVDVIGEIIYTGTVDGVLVCSSTMTANAVVNPNPVLAISPSAGTTFCSNELPEITVTGADYYDFNPPPATEVNGVATYPPGLNSITGFADGSIDYAEITCTSSIMLDYQILETPVVQLAVDGAVLCGPDDSALITTGGMDPATYSFQWWFNGFQITGETNNSVNVALSYPTDAGLNNVACQVTHNNGCIGGSVIQVEMLEGASIDVTSSPICDGDTLFMDTSSNGNITWSANGATPTATGYYYYPVTDGDSYTATATVTSASIIAASQYDCTASQTIVVDSRANPDLDFIFSGIPCTGQSVQVDISGAENYTWTSDPNETNSSLNPDPGVISNNILSLGYTNVIPGDLNINTTGTITYPDELTCSSSEPFTATINANTSFQLAGSTEICEGECIDLTVDWDEDPNGATFSYDWFLDGNLHSNGGAFTHCPTYASGTAEVTLVVEAGNACQSSHTVFVNTTELPIITMAADVVEGCNPLTVNFNATNQFASVTAWNFDNGQSETGIDNVQMTFDCGDYDNGDCIYNVSYTAISPTNPNCTASEFTQITVHPIPESDFFLSESIVCFESGVDAIIEANNISSDITGLLCNGSTNAPYNWTLFPTGSGDCTESVNDMPNLFAAGTGNFSIGLETTDVFGCSSQSFQDFQVVEAPVPEIGFFSTSVCLPTQIEILNTTTGAASFDLEVPGFVIPTNFNSPFYLDVEFPGIYEAEFTVTSNEGCSVTVEYEDAFEAWYPPLADFTTDPEDINILDPTVNFVNLTQGGTEFIWSFGDGDGSSEVNPQHEYYETGSYDVQLLVTNQYGCTDVSTQTINVSNLLQIWVPNSFTPNNDGNNDAWIPRVSGQELIQTYECWVYDRWGKLVYFSTTPEEPWVGDNMVDGLGTHYVSSTEAFTWRIEIKMVDGLGARTETGHVYLVR